MGGRECVIMCEGGRERPVRGRKGMCEGGRGEQ